MPNSSAQTLSGQFQDGVDTATDALRAAAASTQEVSEEASEVLDSATTEIAKLAESLSAHALDAARYAKHEVEAHPLASLAAALTAVVAVMGVVAAGRRAKS